MHGAQESRGRAAKLWDSDSGPLIANSDTRYWWIADGSIWYRQPTPDGVVYLAIDPNGGRSEAFDRGTVAAAMGLLTRAPCHVEGLRLVAVEGNGCLMLAVGKASVRYSPITNSCEYVKDDEIATGSYPSPSGGASARCEAFELFITSPKYSGPITASGTALSAWARKPMFAAGGLARLRRGGTQDPELYWSKDGSYLVTWRFDESCLASDPFLDHLGHGLTEVRDLRVGRIDDSGPRLELIVYCLADGLSRRLDFPDAVDYHELIYAGPSWLLVLYRSSTARAAGVVKLDLAKGTFRTIIHERYDAFITLNTNHYSQANVRAIRGGEFVVWYSERSGAGHLYLYDVLSGDLLRDLTPGSWHVRDIVDVCGDVIFFTACGRLPANPYLRHLCRVDLIGSEVVDLTPDDLDHCFDGPPSVRYAGRRSFEEYWSPISPTGRAFLDISSTLRLAPKVNLRSTVDGHLIASIGSADATRLYAAGWQPPESVRFYAADWSSELWGALYLPAGWENAPVASIPLVVLAYGAAQVAVTPHDFLSASTGAFGAHASSLALLGIAALVVDTRGSPGRGRRFHNEGYTSRFPDVASDDYVAVLRQLKRSHACIDFARVGIYGHSFGGTTAVRAMLRYPSWFKVAISSAGIHSKDILYKSYAEFLPQGETSTSSTAGNAEGYAGLDNCSLASRLQGKLLLCWGDMDDSAPPRSTLLLVEALIRADRKFDLLCLPGKGHSFGRSGYFRRRLWDYLNEHL